MSDARSITHRLAHLLGVHRVTIVSRWYRPGYPGWANGTELNDVLLLFYKCSTCGKEEEISHS